MKKICLSNLLVIVLMACVTGICCFFVNPEDALAVFVQEGIFDRSAPDPTADEVEYLVEAVLFIGDHNLPEASRDPQNPFMNVRLGPFGLNPVQTDIFKITPDEPIFLTLRYDTTNKKFIFSGQSLDGVFSIEYQDLTIANNFEMTHFAVTSHYTARVNNAGETVAFQGLTKADNVKVGADETLLDPVIAYQNLGQNPVFKENEMWRGIEANPIIDPEMTTIALFDFPILPNSGRADLSVRMFMGGSAPIDVEAIPEIPERRFVIFLMAMTLLMFFLRAHFLKWRTPVSAAQ